MDEKKTHGQLLLGQKPSDEAKLKRPLAKLNKLSRILSLLHRSMCRPII